MHCPNRFSRLLRRAVANQRDADYTNKWKIAQRARHLVCLTLRYPVLLVRLLLTVTDVFTIPNRGIVLIPELVPVAQEVFRVGDPLRVRRPDGSEDTVQIGGLEFTKVLNAPCQLLIFLRSKSKDDVPIGTEVWSVT